jgi:hypothetical protein
MFSPIKMIVLILAFLNLGALIAKENLTVLSRSGEVRFRAKTESAWKELKTGENLERNHILKVSIESKVNILLENGKFFSISTPGEYDIDNIITKIKGKKSGFSDRFFNTVYNIISSNIDYFRDNKYNRENAVSGIVLRNYQSLYPVQSPVNSNFINNEVVFRWYRRDSEKTYTFRIKDMYEREVFTKSVSDTTIKLNLSQVGLLKGKYYFWQIANANGRSDENYIFLISDDKSLAIKDSLEMIDKEFETESEKALHFLVRAQYYEDNNLIYNAYSTFVELLSKYPGNKDYKKFFVLFLIRHNMMDEAHVNLE